MENASTIIAHAQAFMNAPYHSVRSWAHLSHSDGPQRGAPGNPEERAASPHQCVARPNNYSGLSFENVDALLAKWAKT